MNEKRQSGVALLFAPRAEIEAAPAEEREAYFAIVEGLLANPEAAGFRFETAADRAADDAGDNTFGGLSEDWGTA